MKTINTEKKNIQGLVTHIPAILPPGRQRQEDQVLRVILGSVASLKLAWATWDFISERDRLGARDISYLVAEHLPSTQGT